MKASEIILPILIGSAVGVVIALVVAKVKKDTATPAVNTTENRNNLPENENTPMNQSTADWNNQQ